jgi:hypothetical protein
MHDISWITAKVKKLLALAERAGTEAEAFVAAARAQELIERYNLSVSTEELEGEKGVERDSGCGSARMSPHIAILGRAACKLFDCAFFYHSAIVDAPEPRYRYSYRRTLRFVGLVQNVECCVLTFNYLVASVESLLKGTLNARDRWTRSDYRAYRLGCAQRILSMAKDMKEQRVEIGGEHVKALVRIGQDLATQYIKDLKLGGVHHTNEHHGYSDEAYTKGYEDAERIDIHGAGTSRMLG